MDSEVLNGQLSGEITFAPLIPRDQLTRLARAYHPILDCIRAHVAEAAQVELSWSRARELCSELEQTLSHMGVKAAGRFIFTTPGGDLYDYTFAGATVIAPAVKRAELGEPEFSV